MVAPALSSDLRQLLEAYPADVRKLVVGARELLFAVLPHVSEFPDLKSRVIGYGTGSSYRDTIATLILSRKGVKIGIVGGASLADPERLLAGSGKVHRYVATAEPADLKRPALTQLLKSAYAAWQERQSGT
jgi:hypothetical protein